MKRTLLITAPAVAIFGLALLAPHTILAASPTVDAGVTLSVKGTASAGNPGTDLRDLKRGSKIFESDEVLTGADSSAQFRMKDGATFTLSSNTQLLISEYQDSNSGDPSDSAAMELVEGTFRFVSGAIGKERHDDWKLKAGGTSIGIRGTEAVVEKTIREVIITILDGRIVIFADECPDTVIGRGTKYNFFKYDESGCSASYVAMPFSNLAPDVFFVTPIESDNNTEEGGGGGGNELVSPN